MPTDIQKNGKWLMRIGLKYQGMVLVTMMFVKPIPIIGFLMKGEQWNSVGQPGFSPGGACGGEFPQNKADGEKLPNLFELNNIVKNECKRYCTAKIKSYNSIRF